MKMNERFSSSCALVALSLLSTPSSATRPVEVADASPRAASPRFADDDPSNDSVVAPPEPLTNCAERLRDAGITFRSAELPLKQKLGNTYTCGAHQAVLYVRGPGKIRYSSPPVVTCALALALARFETVIQEEAQRAFGGRVTRIEQGGTYSCRRMTRFRDMVSEHSYGNAIDIRSLTLTDGRRITVLGDFGPVASEPRSVKSRFLRSIARRFYDEAVFSVVLTPYWDALHRDHFHLDLARYRVDGTR